MLKNTLPTFAAPVYLKLFFVVVFCMVTLCNCGSSDSQRPIDAFSAPIRPSPNPPIVNPQMNSDFIDTEIETRIIYDYFNNLRDGNHDVHKIDDVWIAGYYGTYNGGFAVIMGCSIPIPGPAVLRTTIIADIEFYYSSGFNIIIWKEGQFYGLQKAYDFGLLTQDDLLKISEQWVMQRDEQLEQLEIND